MSKPDYRLWYEKPPTVWLLDVLYVLVRLWIGFSKLTGYFRHQPSNRLMAAALRSSHWPTVRRKWLADHSTCRGCGTTKDLQVHHKRPFHLHPELELSPTNLITLCEHNGCHYALGHFYSWSDFNPKVEEDSTEWLTKLEAHRHKSH